jgi:hypothetical protein
MAYSAFYHCDKIPERNSLKEERFILASGFRDFGPWSADSIALKPGVRQKHHGKRNRLKAARKQR